MKITSISDRPIAIPYRTPWRNRHTEEAGAPMTHLRTAIIEVQTDKGITGLGQAQGGGLEPEVRQKVGEVLLGQDPTNISCLVPLLEERIGRGTVVGGFDFALHDIKGKALGVPVYQLFGGKHRERVPLVWTLPYLSIEEQIPEARRRVQEGFTHAVKMKVGVPGDLEHLLAVAGEIGDVPIRPDSNMGHTKEEALSQLDQMKSEGVHFELVEDPCPTDWDDYQEIGETLGLPISVHGGMSSFEALASLIRAARPAIRCMNIMPTFWGLFRTAQIVGALEAAGIGWTMGTSHDSSIKVAAALHLAAALPNRLYPCDLLGPRLHVDDVAAEPLEIIAGYGVAPDKPGLGIELNEDVIAKWAVDSSANEGSGPVVADPA